MTSSIGVAVIGGGMAGRAHAAGYRTASTLFGTDRPDVRLVAIADTNQAVADDTAKRYGYERAEYGWRAIAESPDIDAVSVVVANQLHREIVEGLLAAGKHVLCEKPLAGSIADAEAMVRGRRGCRHGRGRRVHLPPVAGHPGDPRELATGRLGDIIHFNGHYWCDYGLDPASPITWRYRGGPGTGALADVGSHLLDMAEFVCGPIVEISGATFTTVITERPVPAGVTYGHTKAEPPVRVAPVENEDLATFTARFQNGAVGTFSASRVAHQLPDGLGFELFASGSAAFDLARAGGILGVQRGPRQHRERSASGDHRTGAPVHPGWPADGCRRSRPRQGGVLRVPGPSLPRPDRRHRRPRPAAVLRPRPARHADRRRVAESAHADGAAVKIG